MSLYVIQTHSLRSRLSGEVYSFGLSGWLRLREGKKVDKTAAHPKRLDYEELLGELEEFGRSQFEIALFDSANMSEEAVGYLYDYALTHDVSVGLLFDEVSQELSALLASFGLPVYVDRSIDEQQNLFRASNDGFFLKAMMASPEASFGAVHASKEMPIRHEKEPLPLEKPFRDQLMEHLIASGMSNAEVYRKAGISRQVFSNILSNENVIPSKATVFCLILGLSLPYEEASTLLRCAGYAFSHSIRCDLIVEDYVRRGIYDIDRINVELLDHGCPPLGWHPRED